MSENAKQIFAILKLLRQRLISDWLHICLFSWRWWVGVSFVIIPWILWIIFSNKKSTDRLLYIGFFSIAVSFLVNSIGISLNLWTFEYRIAPLICVFVPSDISLIPVSIMLILQFKPHKFVPAKALFFAGFSAFVAEPFFHFLKFYYLVNWSYAYSFVLYILLFLACSVLLKRNSFDPL